MSETTVEKKLPVRNLERITEQKCGSYDEAKLIQQVGPKDGKVKNFDECDKIKIFARYDGTFDVVWYRKIGTVVKKAVQALEKAAMAEEGVVEKPVHGLKSKDRKKSPKKAR